MSHDTVGSPVRWFRKSIVSGWRTLKSVYYANSMSWRFIKSGTLVFFGFFLWTAANVLLSVQPTWTWLYYPMAYGFILIVYGPIHHLAVIPIALRWRRSGGLKTQIGRHLPNTGLAVFLVLVVILGTFPPGVMAFEFTGVSGGGDSTDVNPDLLCTKHVPDNGETTVHCHLSNSTGVDHIDVMSGDEKIYTDNQPPFEFTISEDEMATARDRTQFQVVLKDENDNMIRRYIRTLSSIEEEEASQ